MKLSKKGILMKSFFAESRNRKKLNFFLLLKIICKKKKIYDLLPLL